MKTTEPGARFVRLGGRRGPGLPLCLLVLLFSGPERLAGRSCLGRSANPNSAELALRYQAQNEGHRLGGSVGANIAGVLGIVGGVSGGEIDRFASGGSEVGALLWVSPLGATRNGCLFGQYEAAEETFRSAFDQDRGTYRERWFRLGLGLGRRLVEVGGVTVHGHAAPEVIWRKSRMEGRALHDDDGIYVLETTKEEYSTHLGARGMISARHSRFSVLISLKNRPRIGSDLEWSAQIGFPI